MCRLGTERVIVIVAILLAAARVASAQTVYLNDCSSTDGFSSSYDEPFLYDYGGDTGVAIDFPPGAGYGGPTAMTLSLFFPIDLTNSELTCTMLAESLADPLGSTGVWLRFWDGDAHQGAWFYDCAADAGWQTFETGLNVPDYQPDVWDPTNIVSISFTTYNWNMDAAEFRYCVGHLEITLQEGTPPVAIADAPLTYIDPPGLVELDGSGSYDPDGGTIVRYIWKADGQPIADRLTPDAWVYLPSNATSSVTLTVVNDAGVFSAMSDPLDITVTACDETPDGYSEDWSTDLDGLNGYYTQYLEDGGGKMTVPVDAGGYVPFWGVRECPVFDVTNGTINITLRIENDGGVLPPNVGWWLRLHNQGGGDSNYQFLVDSNAGWQTFQRCVNDPDENDPATIVTDYTLQAVVWEESERPYKMGIQNFEILPAGEPVVAHAGDDQFLDGACGPNTVQLEGGYEGPVVNHVWTEYGEVLSTELNPEVELGPGAHVITLTVDDGACQSDSDDVVITIDADFNEPPISIPMHEQINYHPQPESHPELDAITINTEDGIADWLEFIESPEEDRAARVHLAFAGGWYWGPAVALDKACYQTPIDITAPGLTLRCTARYFQAERVLGDPPPPPYEDAPVGLVFYDVYGHRGTLAEYGDQGQLQIRWLIGPDDTPHNPDPPYDAYWVDVEATDLNLFDFTDTYVTDPDFDPTQVVGVGFHGTDWTSEGQDYVDVRDLWLGVGGGTYELGDLNCDGAVDLDDIEPFALALVDPAAYESSYPGCNSDMADINGDGTNDGNDIGGFIDCVLNLGCPTICGDGTCDEPEEDCATCPEDCGACPFCGDGTCDEPEEDCATCPDDCGACAECGNPEAGDCCENNGTEFCDDADCCDCVCDLDPYCCGDLGGTWDNICADEACSDCSAVCDCCP